MSEKFNATQFVNKWIKEQVIPPFYLFDKNDLIELLQSAHRSWKTRYTPANGKEE